jgi:hypothetical protein
MLRIPRRYRPWLFLFCLWLAFEPMVIPMVQAEELPKPKPETISFANLDSFREAAKVEPDKMFQDIIAMQADITPDMEKNKVKGKMSGRAYMDFLMTVSSAYDMMDAGDSDTISIVDVLKALPPLDEAQKQIGITNAAIKAVTSTDLLGKLNAFAERGTKKLFMFFGRAQRAAEVGSMKRNTLKVFTVASNNTRKLYPKIGEFLSHLDPPQGASAQNPMSASKQYFEFFKKGTDSGMSKTTFAAHSVGIGLSVLQLGLAIHGIATNDDTYSGNVKVVSYTNVKHMASAIVAACALLAMAWAFPFGTIAAIGGVVILLASFIGDKLGEHNAKWKAAYRRSFDFLYQQGNDPKFENFYNQRNLVKDRYKSAAWLVYEKKFAKLVEGTEGKVRERVQGICTTLEKQGVLATYYNKRSLVIPPELDINTMMDLWKKKASYMSWKPTEEEKKKEAERSTFSKALDYVAVWNYPIWGVNKIQETLADRDMKNQLQKYHPVVFNPDFVLQRRYQQFLISNRNHQGTLYSVVGLRVEQAPFNYIWMIALDSSQWSEDLMLAALEGDVFFCGVKEMKYLGNVLEAVVDELKAASKASDKKLSQMEKDLTHMAKQRKYLKLLMKTYEEEKDLEEPEKIDWMYDAVSNEHRKKYWDVWTEAAHYFGWNASNFRPHNSSNTSKPLMNAKNIFQKYKADLEQRLAGIPMSINRKIATMIQLDLFIKGVLDRYALYKKLGEERQEALNSFDNDFQKYPALHKYLAEKKFLGVGDGFLDGTMDWLSGIYAAKTDMDANVNLYMDAVEDYGALADKLKADQRGWWIFKYDFPNPDEMCQKLNEELKEWEDVIAKAEEVSNEIDLEILCPSGSEWYKERKLVVGKDDRKSMDPNEDLSEDILNLDAYMSAAE